MARFPYDVNTTTRLIDVHKRFDGGLKTVDTDDALGAVFLRDSENISLSELGFIEKRYGTFEKLSFEENQKLQFYYDFEGHTLHASNGVLYDNGVAVTRILEEDATWRYPENVFETVSVCTFESVGRVDVTQPTDPSTTEPANCAEGIYYYSQCSLSDSTNNIWSCTRNEAVITTEYELSLQKTRDINAVNVNGVLYIFTGTYPIYVKLDEETNELKFYMFSIDVPNYNELVVTGHNLLEYDYENIYFEQTANVGDNEGDLEVPENFEEDTLIETIKTQINPRIPYVKDEENPKDAGKIDFFASFKYPGTLLTQKFPDNKYYYEMDLIETGYRASGSGATTLDFQIVDPKEIDFQPISNYNSEEELDLYVEPELKLVSKSQPGAAMAEVIAEEDYLFSGGAVLGNFKKLKAGFTIDVDKEFIAQNKDKQLYYSFIRKELDLDQTETRYTFEDFDIIPRIQSGEYSNDVFTSLLSDTNFIQDAGDIPYGEIKLSLTPFRIQEDGENFYFEDSKVSSVDIIIRDKNYIMNLPPSIDFPDIDGFRIDFHHCIISIDGNDGIWQTLFYDYDYLINKAPISFSGTEYEVPGTHTVKTGVDYRFAFETDVAVESIFIGDTELISFEEEYVRIPDSQTESFLYTTRFTIPPGSNGEQTFKIVFENAINYNGDFVFVENQAPRLKQSSSPLTSYPAVLPYRIGTETIQEPITFLESLGFIQRLVTYDKFFESSPFTAKISNLINGLYDFRFSMSLTKYEKTEGFLSIVETNNFDFFFPEVSITSEKLTDYEFFQDKNGNAKHPIWSCNRVIEHFNKIMVWGSEEMPNSLFYSFPDRPTYFPSKFYIDFGTNKEDPIQAVTNFMNILVVQTLDTTWGLRGNSGIITAPSPYAPFTINPTVGTIAYKSVRPVRNHLFFLSKQGVITLKSLYAADEQYNIDFSDRNIRNIVPQDSEAVGIQFDNQYWLNFPNFGITLRWYIDKKAWVKDNYGNYRNTFNKLIQTSNPWNEFNGVFKYQITDGKLEFITKPSRFESEGNLKVYKIGVDDSLPYDLGQTFYAKFETSFLNQNYSFHLKNYKEFKYDFTIQNEYNPTREPLVKVDTTSGESRFSETFENLGLIKNHTYLISFSEELPVEAILLGEDEVNFTALELNTTTDAATDFQFLVPNSASNLEDLTIVFSEAVDYSGPISILDSTYSENLTFFTKLMSEENNVLNREDDNVGYEEFQTPISIDLEAFKGFTLGSTSFGDRVTLVKTIKISGKGYNIKAYFEDFSNSKWTIETMGITYKMKKARSR